MAESPQVTPEHARAALEEAEMRAGQVRRNDRQLSWVLLVVAAAYLAVGAVMSFSPHRGNTYAGIAVVLMLAVAIGAAVVIGLRIRAYSRAGIFWYFSTIIVFNLWNSVVTAASIGTRFWASGQLDYHFGLSAAVATIPLVIGGVVLARRA